MKVRENEAWCRGVKFSVVGKDGQEMGRAYLYMMQNDLHKRMFAFMEDVYVEEAYRGKGICKKLVNMIIDKAKKENCYKLIACSRHTNKMVHDIYLRIGFKDHGKEFRMDF